MNLKLEVSMRKLGEDEFRVQVALYDEYDNLFGVTGLDQSFYDEEAAFEYKDELLTTTTVTVEDGGNH